ncbi:carboxypeptidase-like regulatory domain-containing protein [Singulisphaera sp. GP187]|uniref:carboxypeptidase-like regulatory domain-containing protein n=1 Tax=Singulisphaera sp. GP187 TaxID=1882752 RepID=UPI0020B1233B|nr:carboxypeptidase-like regulatory domain-containing protein [Singulisphaera sp. GP187]
MTRRQTLWTVVLAVVSGCSKSDVEGTADGPDFSNLVPVSGVVTLNGEPLAGAVVTFLPPQWSPGIGETDAKGEYSLSSSGRPGLAPGEYKVAISLLLSAEGEPQGLGPRSSLAQPPGMLTAKEMLPREYADLGTSKLIAKVNPKGGHFAFDVKAPGLVLPTPTASPAKEADAAAEGDQPAKPVSPGDPPAPATNSVPAP